MCNKLIFTLKYMNSFDYKKDCLYHLDVSFAGFKATGLDPDIFLAWFTSKFAESFLSDYEHRSRFYWTNQKLYKEMFNQEQKSIKKEV